MAKKEKSAPAISDNRLAEAINWLPKKDDERLKVMPVRVEDAALQVPAPTPAPTTYDNSNAKKSGIGVMVLFAQGQGKLLFPLSCSWRWKHIAGKLFLEVFERDNEDVQLQAPFEAVFYVAGPTTLFRDAEWR